MNKNISKNTKIAIVGGGAWGTALAQMVTRAGCEAVLWAREIDVVKSINENHENTVFLPGIKLSEKIRATSNHSDLSDADFIFMVVPAQFVRLILSEIKPHISESAAIVLCAKGIEQSTGSRMTEIVTDVLPKSPIVVLSGPTFAREVAIGLPSAVTIASKYQQVVKKLSNAIGQPSFRPYLSRDVVGAEIGGALKNVLAIACGITAGRKMGENARAALITRGMSEIVRFGEIYGAERTTMMGLCGLGDLILTCSSLQSRNMSLGYAIGEGKSVKDIMSGRKSIAEGYYTASILAKICREEKIDLPIVLAVNDILHEGKDLSTVIDDLLNRPIVNET
ncbi:MAG: NAD(P)-dependent glycerol-3-phosphate dehydrogenase [Proteobacteria bacterium]|jgi:glycerol-3-phosphate dehydrogenase (NAD(P)+)|nr:NAD(P)-dependent glycerol-3-phosphate dehydrogenase [Pseudomonadota bacterium]